MDPLAISSIAVTSFSIILSIGTAIYKAVKKHQDQVKYKEHHSHEEGGSFSDEHKEHHHKHKENGHKHSKNIELTPVNEHGEDVAYEADLSGECSEAA